MNKVILEETLFCIYRKKRNPVFSFFSLTSNIRDFEVDVIHSEVILYTSKLSTKWIKILFLTNNSNCALSDSEHVLCDWKISWRVDSADCVQETRKQRLSESWGWMIYSYYLVDTSSGWSVEYSDFLLKHRTTPESFHSLPQADNLSSILWSSSWNMSTSLDLAGSSKSMLSLQIKHQSHQRMYFQLTVSFGWPGSWERQWC